MVSIVIPAYNEEAVIQRTLKTLLERIDVPDLEVIVCCNGCTDRTAEIARKFGPPVQVLETSHGSKILALNMGDSVARTFPRIYLDADILLSSTAVKEMVRVLTETNVLAVAPRMRVDLSGRSMLIRAFYNIWLKTPYHTKGMIGSGVYGLSEAGRKRFDKFPDIIADDGFVRAQFETRERQILDNCEFTVIPPTSFASLLRIKTRADLGIKELRLKHPELIPRLGGQDRSSGEPNWIWSYASKPLLWPQLMVYLWVKTVATIRAKRQLKSLVSYRWERDETSRT